MTYTVHWILEAELLDISRIIKEDLTVEVEDEEYLHEINTELLKMANRARLRLERSVLARQKQATTGPVDGKDKLG